MKNWASGPLKSCPTKIELKRECILLKTIFDPFESLLHFSCTVENQIQKPTINVIITSTFCLQPTAKFGVCTRLCTSEKLKEKIYTLRATTLNHFRRHGHFESSSACKMQVELIRFRIDLIGGVDGVSTGAATCTSTC